MQHVMAIVLIATATIATANDFWAHRIGSTVSAPYGDDPDQVMDIHVPGRWVGEPTYFEAASGPRDTLVWIHGGGWLQGDMARIRCASRPSSSAVGMSSTSTIDRAPIRRPLPWTT